MSNEYPYTHHDFFGTTPPVTPEPEPDEKQRERAENRAVIARLFSTDEGKFAIPLLRNLALATRYHPIDLENADKATQLLWWRSARLALIEEIEAIIAKENNHG